MMVAGTYVLTDTIDRSFDHIFTQSNEGVDAVVTAKEAIETDDGTTPSFSEGVLKRVQATDGVEAAEGSIADPQVSIIGSDGEPRGGNGAPSLGFSVSKPYSDRFDPLDLRRGRPADPRRPGRDRQGVRRRRGIRGRRPGEIAGSAATRQYTLVGIATLGDVDSFGGATIAVLTLPEAQRVTGKEGELDQINVAAAPGVTPEQLAANLNAALPNDGRGRDGSRRTSSPSATTSASSSAS